MQDATRGKVHGADRTHPGEDPRIELKQSVLLYTNKYYKEVPKIIKRRFVRLDVGVISEMTHSAFQKLFH